MTQFNNGIGRSEQSGRQLGATGSPLFMRHFLPSFPQLHGALQIDGYELGDAALGHGDAVEAVHARHGDRIVGDDDEARVGRARHLVEQIAEALDVVVVERRVDLVEHADRRRVGEEDREDQRERRERLLAAGEQRQRHRFLARRLGHDLKAGFERIFALDQLQFGVAAAEQFRKQLLEVLVDGGERCEQPLAGLVVEAVDALPQPPDRLDQIVTFGNELIVLRFDFAAIPARRAG